MERLIYMDDGRVGVRCIRCDAITVDGWDLCDKCLDELDAHVAAGHGLSSICTEQEIEEYCYIHDIKGGNHQ